MAIFAIILREPNPKVQEQINIGYPDRVELSPAVTIIATKHTSETVAQNAGGNHRIDDVSGAVIKLQGTYSGHTIKTLWEWLDEHENDF